MHWIRKKRFKDFTPFLFSYLHSITFERGQFWTLKKLFFLNFFGNANQRRFITVTGDHKQGPFRILPDEL